MAVDEEFRLLFDEPLDIDKGRLSESTRGDVVLGDKDLSILSRPNRVALGLGTVGSRGRLPGQQALSCYDVPLRCVLHAAAGCHFTAARLVVDLNPYGGTPVVLVRDMTPREVKGGDPVEVTTTVSAHLTFDIVPHVLSADAGREQSTTRKVHYPQITTSGKGFHKAIWNFTSVPGQHLHAEHEMRLLVSVPEGMKVSAAFNLVAQISPDGMARVIPLFRKREEIGKIYPLIDAI
jgi:hypothetical protein